MIGVGALAPATTMGTGALRVSVEPRLQQQTRGNRGIHVRDSGDSLGCEKRPVSVPFWTKCCSSSVRACGERYSCIRSVTACLPAIRSLSIPPQPHIYHGAESPDLSYVPLYTSSIRQFRGVGVVVQRASLRSQHTYINILF